MTTVIQPQNAIHFNFFFNIIFNFSNTGQVKIDGVPFHILFFWIFLDIPSHERKNPNGQFLNIFGKSFGICKRSLSRQFFSTFRNFFFSMCSLWALIGRGFFGKLFGKCKMVPRKVWKLHIVVNKFAIFFVCKHYEFFCICTTCARVEKS